MLRPAPQEYLWEIRHLRVIFMLLFLIPTPSLSQASPIACFCCRGQAAPRETFLSLGNHMNLEAKSKTFLRMKALLLEYSIVHGGLFPSPSMNNSILEPELNLRTPVLDPCILQQLQTSLTLPQKCMPLASLP